MDESHHRSPDKWARDGLSLLISYKMFFQGLEKPVPIKVGTKERA